jgi:hypothetical protein
MLEFKKCLPFCLHAFIVCCGLALEEFFPAARIAICSPILHELMHDNKVPAADKLTAKTGLNIGLDPIIKKFESENWTENWGDYPENLHPNQG